VAERIIQLDGIKAVRVRCDLPAQVYIEVEEREPVVMWRALAQGRDWWLDEEGRVLPYPGDVDAPNMVFVVDASDRQLQPRGKLEPASLVASVRQLAQALPEIQVFYYDQERGLSFVQTVDGGQWPVYVGSSENLAYKIQVLQVLIQHLKAESIVPDYVDVRWPDHAVYHLQAGGG
jgi:cell division septal protein FtsQ